MAGTMDLEEYMEARRCGYANEMLVQMFTEEAGRAFRKMTERYPAECLKRFEILFREEKGVGCCGISETAEIRCPLPVSEAYMKRRFEPDNARIITARKRMLRLRCMVNGKPPAALQKVTAQYLTMIFHEYDLRMNSAAEALRRIGESGKLPKDSVFSVRVVHEEKYRPIRIEMYDEDRTVLDVIMTYLEENKE